MSMKSRQFTTGIIGTIVTAICCFTPLLVVSFGLLGVSVWLGWIDIVLLPLLGFFLALTVHALLTKKKKNEPAVALRSTLTCPECGKRSTEIMPTDACQFFYDCRHCGAVLKALPGDCCVYCSYGDIPCPPIQIAQKEGGLTSCHN